MYWTIRGIKEPVEVLTPSRDEAIRAKEVADADDATGSLLCKVRVLSTLEEIYVPLRDLEPAPDGPFRA
jgi:hypothetical protein